MTETPTEFKFTFILYLALNWDLNAGVGGVFYFEDPARKRLPNSEYFDTGGGNGG